MIRTAHFPRFRLLVLSASIAAAGLVAAPMAVLAKDGDVIREGPCTGNSDWKLKLSDENGRIEVEFEVDSNVNGQTWNVRLFQDGERFFAGQRTTQPPSGSFEVRRVVNNRPGVHTFTGRARNPATGEVCEGSASK